MEIEIRTPGGSVSFDIPIMKIVNYSIDDIFEKKLFFLVPFMIFAYEKDFKKYNEDEQALAQLKAEYADLMERLQKTADEGLISAYYWRVIMDMSKKVLENIARKYDNVKEGVETIMGGHVLEHEGKKIYNAGKEEGKKDGMIETLASLVRDKLLSVSEAAKRANMSQPEFEKAAGL